jgi:hypothetical protein
MNLNLFLSSYALVDERSEYARREKRLPASLNRIKQPDDIMPE